MSFHLVSSLERQNLFCGSKIKLLSPAKINLYLNIVRKEANGFHRIESIAERVSLFDEIIIKVKKCPEVDIFCNEKRLEVDSNLCVRAARLLKEKLKIHLGFDIFLKKNIPVGSGLGGGSSNAAFTLLGINTLLGLNLSSSELYRLGGRLGSDVNFFLSQSKFAYLYGRGEKVVPFKGKTLGHEIAWPRINLSTKKVYQEASVKLTKFFNNVKILKYALKKGDTFLLKKSIFNVLEKTVISMCEEVREVKRYLDRKGIFSKVTGSGSALYVILDERLAPGIKDILPKWWLTFTVQTF